jgi:hypothetical protein
MVAAKLEKYGKAWNSSRYIRKNLCKNLKIKAANSEIREK